MHGRLEDPLAANATSNPRPEGGEHLKGETWHRALANAAAFARDGATDEAVARALAVYRATAGALARTPASMELERAVIQMYFDRSSIELGRFREMDAVTKARTAARSEAYYTRERQAMAPRAAVSTSQADPSTRKRTP